MTAPYTPSSSQGMIQTILTLRQLQQQDAAQALARAQFGLAQASTREAELGHLGTLASSLPDPTVLLPHVDSLAQTTGLDPEVLRTIFSNAAPSAAATRDKAVAAGVAAAGGALNAPAASAALTGEQPGQLQLDDLQKFMFQNAHQFLTSLPPDQLRNFNQAVAQKVANGQTPGEALTDQIFASLPQDQQKQAIEIGKGLAPSAGEVIQGRLGAGRLALDQNAAASLSAYQEMQAQAALAEAQARLKGPQLTQATDILKAIQNQQQFLAKQSGNLTPEGLVQQNASLNALYAQLTKIDPGLGRIFTPMPLTGDDKSTHITAPDPFAAFMNALHAKAGAP